MALFSKETCCFCGKEVGMMSRSKLASKEYICSDCKKLTHPFLRVDHMTRDEVHTVMEEMQRNEERFQATEFRRNTRYFNGKTWTFYDNIDQGVFSITCPETEKYQYHYVYDMTLVRPYDKRLDGSATRLPALTKKQVADSITLEEKKDSDGKRTEWVLRIPYFRYDMDIRTSFPAAMKEADVRYIYTMAHDIISNYVGGEQRRMEEKEQLHKENFYRTTGAAVKAAASGKGLEGVAQEIKKGVQAADDIASGKTRKKKGLLARLFGR